MQYAFATIICVCRTKTNVECVVDGKVERKVDQQRESGGGSERQAEQGK